MGGQKVWADDKRVWADEPDSPRVNEAYRLLFSDPDRAYGQLLALADGGSIMSMVYLGWMFRDGIGRKADFPEAEYWFKRVADSGALIGTSYLGELYQIHGDHNKAREIFSIGAAQEYVPAMYLLGRMYVFGSGGFRDDAKGRALLEKCAALGYLRAKAALANMLMRGSDGFRGRIKGLWNGFRFMREAIQLYKHDPDNEAIKPFLNPRPRKSRPKKLWSRRNRL